MAERWHTWLILRKLVSAGTTAGNAPTTRRSAKDALLQTTQTANSPGAVRAEKLSIAGSAPNFHARS